MKPELNLVNELRIEEIFNKINKKRQSLKTSRLMKNFQFENENFTGDNRLFLVHHFEQIKKKKK